MRLTGSYNKNIYHYKVVQYGDFMRKEIEKEFFCFTSKDVESRTNISGSSVKKMVKGDLVLKYLNYEIFKIRENACVI